MKKQIAKAVLCTVLSGFFTCFCVFPGMTNKEFFTLWGVLSVFSTAGIWAVTVLTAK